MGCEFVEFLSFLYNIREETEIFFFLLVYRFFPVYVKIMSKFAVSHYLYNKSSYSSHFETKCT